MWIREEEKTTTTTKKKKKETHGKDREEEKRRSGRGDSLVSVIATIVAVDANRRKSEKEENLSVLFFLSAIRRPSFSLSLFPFPVVILSCLFADHCLFLSLIRNVFCNLTNTSEEQSILFPLPSSRYQITSIAILFLEMICMLSLTEIRDPQRRRKYGHGYSLS